jgi:hypothetical protein
VAVGEHKATTEVPVLRDRRAHPIRHSLVTTEIARDLALMAYKAFPVERVEPGKLGALEEQVIQVALLQVSFILSRVLVGLLRSLRRVVKVVEAAPVAVVELAVPGRKVVTAARAQAVPVLRETAERAALEEGVEKVARAVLEARGGKGVMVGILL